MIFAPVLLIVLIIHIIIAIRWMLIKILSALINCGGSSKKLLRVVIHMDKGIIARSS